MQTPHRQHLGRLGERLAADHFARLGFSVLAQNHHTRFGELDLVLSDGRTLVFCEVKTRRLGSGEPLESLHGAKQSQVRRIAASMRSACSSTATTASCGWITSRTRSEP